ncbi:MAG TPA: helix-turn-helix transcriptional regulator [Parafilimonas sp.]|nr:helix-turn-helix transcriptional regulator [Parafilimonas sp.]
MNLYIKNMVCHRCKLAVENELKALDLHPLKIELGEVLIQEDALTGNQHQVLSNNLKQLGFELLDDKRKKIIEQIKTLIIQSIHYNNKQPEKNYSAFIAENLHHDYSYLSKLFSETEGITIEQFIINQKIEKVKELLVYDEKSLSEIAFETGYSSLAHLSSQFKKVTGLTPTQFKQSGIHHRKTLDKV